MSLTAKETIYKHKENELISASKLYREKLQGTVNEAAYYKMLERMCKSGELVKIAKGIYHRPKKSKYGLIPPSEREIISAFTENGTGTVIGYSLYNSLGLTTQISKSIAVLSSRVEGDTKTIRNIFLKQAKLVYSKEVSRTIHCLEVLQNFAGIQDINYSAFLSFAEAFSEEFSEQVFETVYAALSYKKSTVSFLHEILSYHGIHSPLSKYLSTLSEYKHPKMEELYEIARASR